MYICVEVLVFGVKIVRGLSGICNGVIVVFVVVWRWGWGYSYLPWLVARSFISIIKC